MKGTLLIVDDQAEILGLLEKHLVPLGFEVHTAATGRKALERFDETSPDAVLLDVMLPDMSGLDVLAQLKARSEFLPVVMMSGSGTIDIAVAAMRSGARHFIQKPLDPDGLVAILEQTLESSLVKRQLTALRRTYQTEVRSALPGTSAAIRSINELLLRLAPATSPVLLQGETGTGKGLVARILHDLSPRKAAPWVEVNCAGLSDELLASELFGHERGAFTGAVSTRQGLFEIANRGTIFLDEIAEMEPQIQARLLKVIEDQRFRRVGGTRDIRVDVRIVAATNRELPLELEAGRFREDLYYRLNVLELRLPPLRERVSDIPAIVEALLEDLGQTRHGRLPEVSAEAMRKLQSQRWPGNVRQLRNTLERALLMSKTRRIEADDIAADRSAAESPQTRSEDDSPILPLKTIVRSHVQRALESAGGNVRQAARLLGVSPATIYAHKK